MKITTHPIPLALLTSVPATRAWGTLGHTAVAYVASSFVQPATRDLFQDILHDSSDAYLAAVATWADSFRYTAAGRFSAPFHFIDAGDNPPTSCGVEYARDCGEQGCVVGAIQNYLVGDIHQPLHVENMARGGNGIGVLFDGKHVNLHHVWDTSIAEQIVGGYALPFAEAWAENLTRAIREGEYKSLAPAWLEGVDLADPVTTSLGWAEETNKLVCTAVLPAGREGVQDQELNGTYTEKAVPVVRLQVAKAGYRLAQWLDRIAAAQVKREEL
ncbi:hypothetical protein PZA11_000089 [Diplocarpon coronariae]